MSSVWDKLCEHMTDLAELYGFTNRWIPTKAEGDRLKEENKVLQGHIDNMRTDCLKLEAIREIMTDNTTNGVYKRVAILEVLGE